MLALFSNQNNKSKSSEQEESSIDILSFLTKPTPSSKEQKKSESSKTSIDNLLDVTQELQQEKPTLTKSAQKLIEKVNQQVDKRSKDVVSATKKLNQSLKKHIPEATKDYKKPSPINNVPSIKEKMNKKQQDPELKKKLLEFSRNFEDYQDDPEKLEELKRLLNKTRGKVKEEENGKNGSNDSDEYDFKIKSKKDPSNKDKSRSDSKIKSSTSNSKPMDKPKSISKGKYEEYDPLNPSRINSKKSSNEYDPLETVVRRDKVNSNKPVSKPSENIKRINDKPPLKKLEPELVKKPKLSEMDKKKTLKSVFQGPLKSKQQYDSYDEEEEDDYDENDSFINDDDQEEEAQRILAQMFGGFRQKMAQRKHLDYDTDDMEARFEDIEKEEYFSRKIAQREDEEQARLLKMEKLKKKHKH